MNQLHPPSLTYPSVLSIGIIDKLTHYRILPLDLGGRRFFANISWSCDMSWVWVSTICFRDFSSCWSCSTVDVWSGVSGWGGSCSSRGQCSSILNTLHNDSVGWSGYCGANASCGLGSSIFDSFCGVSTSGLEILGFFFVMLTSKIIV